MTKIYCEVCEQHQPLVIEEMNADELNGDKIWGDLLCSEFSFVIATIEVEKPGTYVFARVAE